MRFASKRNPVFYVVLAMLFVLQTWILVDVHQERPSPTNFLVMVPVLIFLWILYGTHYSIKGEYLYWRSAFIRGKINIQDITRLDLNKTMWVGLKPALDFKGIIINYARSRRIYISPEDKKGLVSALLHVNRKIEVVEN